MSRKRLGLSVLVYTQRQPSGMLHGAVGNAVSPPHGNLDNLDDVQIDSSFLGQKSHRSEDKKGNKFSVLEGRYSIGNTASMSMLTQDIH